MAAILDIGFPPKTIGHMALVLSITTSNLRAIGQRILDVIVRKRFFTKSHVAAILDLGFPPKTIGHMVLVMLMAISNLKAIGQEFFELSSGNAFSDGRIGHMDSHLGYRISSKNNRAHVLCIVNRHIKFESNRAKYILARLYRPDNGNFTNRIVAAILDLGFPP